MTTILKRRRSFVSVNMLTGSISPTAHQAHHDLEPLRFISLTVLRPIYDTAQKCALKDGEAEIGSEPKRTPADYHFVYKDVEGASTQWDDIQRKLGNLPPKEPTFKPPAFTPAPDSVTKDKSWIDEKTEEELEDLEDDLDLDDDRFLEDYRKQRLAEMREAAKVMKFGCVLPISGSDFVREVSQAPPDVWVVVHLYKEGIPECGVLMESLEELARRYPATKFVKIISTECIPNYPDRNLPTLLVYNAGNVKANYVGMHNFGKRCTPEAVALVLCQSDPVLNDGHSGGDASRKTVIEGERKRLIERIVKTHVDNDDGSDSD